MEVPLYLCFRLQLPHKQRTLDPTAPQRRAAARMGSHTPPCFPQRSFHQWIDLHQHAYTTPASCCDRPSHTTPRLFNWSHDKAAGQLPTVGFEHGKHIVSLLQWHTSFRSLQHVRGQRGRLTNFGKGPLCWHMAPWTLGSPFALTSPGAITSGPP